MILLAIPKFPYVPESRKKKSPELATLWNDKVHDLPPPKNGRVQTLPPLKSPQLATLPFFGGDKSWTLSFQRVASSGPVFSGFWHIGTFGGGKKDQPPCMYCIEKARRGVCVKKQGMSASHFDSSLCNIVRCSIHYSIKYIVQCSI